MQLFTSQKLSCLATEAHEYERFAQGCTWQWSGCELYYYIHGRSKSYNDEQQSIRYVLPRTSDQSRDNRQMPYDPTGTVMDCISEPSLTPIYTCQDSSSDKPVLRGRPYCNYCNTSFLYSLAQTNIIWDEEEDLKHRLWGPSWGSPVTFEPARVRTN